MRLDTRELDLLVIKAEQIVSEIPQEKLKADSGKTQMSNAIDVAQSTKSIAVFRNWLRYQSERQAAKDFWTLSTKTGTVAKVVANFASELSKEPDQHKAIYKLVLFLGFMRRAVVAHKQLSTIAPFIEGERI